MMIQDFEPSEVLASLVDDNLADVLAEGQIANLWHEMLRVKVGENCTEIDLHQDLFNINQLLYKAYNGKFPQAKITIVHFEIRGELNDAEEITKETALKAISYGLSDNNLLNRLLGNQIQARQPFPEVEGIVWDLQNKRNDVYYMRTSEK